MSEADRVPERREPAGRLPANDVTPGRLCSLDAFRGLAVAGMILVNSPGSWAYVYAPLRHAEWHGVTPTDLVFPFFLFAVGVSLSFSFAARQARGNSRRSLQLHVLQRSCVLYLLGLFLAVFPTFDFQDVRLVGVLARIGIVYLVVGTLALHLSRRALAAVGGILLLGYWAAMSWIPVPGGAAGDLSPGGNLAAYLDRLLLGDHMWRGAGGVYDPEGLLSTAPALVTTFLGVFAGDYLRRGRDSGRPGERTTLGLAAAGAVLLGVGWAWGLAFSLNKPLWTSSYVLYTAGWASLALAALFWLIDVRVWRRWAQPLVVYGTNAITVFVASGLLTIVLLRWRVPVSPGAAGSGETTSMYAHIYQTAFASWAGPLNGSLAFAVATVLLWLAVASLMHRSGVHIKV